MCWIQFTTLHPIIDKSYFNTNVPFTPSSEKWFLPPPSSEKKIIYAFFNSSYILHTCPSSLLPNHWSPNASFFYPLQFHVSYAIMTSGKDAVWIYFSLRLDKRLTIALKHENDLNDF
jgi:hypothetical protein